MTLREISDITKISAIHLKAIENADYHSLPPPVYSKSFIRKYCEALGTESGPILRRYENYLLSERSILETKGPVKKKPFSKNALYLTAVIAVIVVMGAIYSLTSTSSQKDSVTEILAPAPAVTNDAKLPAVTQPEAANIAVSAPTADGSVPGLAPSTGATSSGDDMELAAVPPEQAAEKKEPASVEESAGKSHKLIIEAKAVTWLRITSDDNSSEVLLKPGDRIERRADSGFKIDCGNAGGVDMSFDGKTLGRLGKTGEVVHLKLP